MTGPSKNNGGARNSRGYISGSIWITSVASGKESEEFSCHKTTNNTTYLSESARENMKIHADASSITLSLFLLPLLIFYPSYSFSPLSLHKSKLYHDHQHNDFHSFLVARSNKNSEDGDDKNDFFRNKEEHNMDEAKRNMEEAQFKKDMKDEAFKRKMEMVRSLQKSFYNSRDSDDSLMTISESGVIHNLPLWRVSWTELPGRSNVLIVHETLYTNMFETILNRKEPFYFGHLFLEGGSKSLQKSDERYTLKSWRQEKDFTANMPMEQQNSQSGMGSAVIGSLLRIVDYRRMSDGNLLLLVQALDRFVVTKAIREIPYALADVQLLPDTEETQHFETGMCSEETEMEVSPLRSDAITESFRYQDYEYDETIRLPVPDRDDLSKSDVVGSRLSKVLPLVPYSKTIHPVDLDSMEVAYDTSDIDDALFTSEETSLENQLGACGILHAPLAHPEIDDYSKFSSDELEEQLWICIDDYLRITRKSVQAELLSLLPRNKKWPSKFLLESTAAFLEESSDASFTRVDEDYPARRRQKRLSYAVTALLEKTEVGNLRQSLLEIPSTQARLSTIVERFEIANSDLSGEFGEFM